MKAERQDQFEPSSGRVPDADLLVVIGIACAAFFYLSFAPALFNDGDTSWHLAAGRWMIAQGRVPDVDPFSFTFAGKPWVAHEWLSEMMMAAAFHLAGWAGLSLLFGAVIGGVLLMIGLEARRRLRGLPLVVLVLSLFVLLAPSMLARPHVLAWPLLAGWTIVLLRAREADRPPHFAAVLLMLLWANMHGSFLFGLVLTGAFALDALLQSADRRRVLIQWGTFGLAATAASLATPHGVHGLLFPIQLSQMESLPLIAEWRRTNLLEQPAFAIILIAAAAWAIRARPRLPIARLLLLLVMLVLAFQHVRHHAVLAIVGALLLLEPLAGRSPAKSRMGDRYAWTPPLAAVLLLCVIRPLLPSERQDSPSNPVTALARLPASLKRQPVFNNYSFGGPLILDGSRAFIDGRADMYGDRFVLAHDRIIQGDIEAFRQAAERWNIRWTILSPDDPLAARLDALAGWQQIYSDPWAVVHIARP